jgi:hypothetical protein
MTENNGAGVYTQPIVMILKSLGPLSGRVLKTRCDSDFQISQNESSFYRCLRGLRYLGFVQIAGGRYELTSFGSELTTKSGDAFYNYYLLGYIRCPECGKKGNSVRCKIVESITEFKKSKGVLIRCAICGYTKAPRFRNISREEFMRLYNLI